MTGSELLTLDSLLGDLGGDSVVNFLLIYSALNQGGPLEILTKDSIEDNPPQIFVGTSFLDVRRAAAYELFELYYPDEYRVWEKSTCDGLTFDEDRFLDSPSFSTEEIRLGDKVFLLVSSQ